MEEFSNKYFLTGTTPADSTAWRTLFDAMVAQERTCYPSTCSVVGGYGYASADPTAVAVWSVDLTVAPNSPQAGTMNPAGGTRLPGDAAVWVRWGLNRFNTKGKRVFLRKYFHPAYGDATTVDNIFANQSAALLAFGAKLDDGSFTGGRVITDHLGTGTVGHAVGPYVTTRTLKRRGKRPPP